MNKNEWAKYLQVNCRTCANVTPTKEGTFYCAKNEVVIPNKAQHEAYDCHAIHPDLVPWKQINSGQDFVAAYEINGNQIRNGQGFTPSQVLLNDVVNTVLGEFECQSLNVKKS